MMICPVCGNETESSNTTCPFCSYELDPPKLGIKQPDVVHRIINIEQGRPFVETALKMMENQLRSAQAEQVRVVTLIHGYGSSGKGGRIRTECRKVLDYFVQQKTINSVIPGEMFRKRNGSGKALLHRYPQLEQRCASDFSNPGITIVVLR